MQQTKSGRGASHPGNVRLVMSKTAVAADTIRRWREHPLQMVQDLWGVTPDPWQADVLEAFPHHQRIAMRAAKGVGKSTVLSWMAWNFLLTRPEPNIAATSINAKNLEDGLWKEMAKWQSRSDLLKQTFEWTKQRIFARENPANWWMSARTFAQTADVEQLGKTLAGIHADRIMFILDESGGMPLAILPTAEAALAGTIEAHIVQAGNPISLNGPLYRACVHARNLWHVVEITGDPDNPMRSPRIPVEYAREQIAQYGRDNPFVKVNIFGEFPDANINSLIGIDEVTAAFKRHYRENEYVDAPKVLGVDVAAEGDDSSSIIKRQGIVAFKAEKHRNIRPSQGAGRVARIWDDWGADACFVDNTGGFGSGWIDQLMLLGKTPIAVHYSGEAHQKHKFFNKRTEMYFDAVEWIRRGGALAESAEMAAALTQTTYSFRGDRLLLEPKALVKKKIGFSPDETDSFVQTFGEPVMPRGTRVAPRSAAQTEWNPFAEKPDLGSAVSQSYSPFRD